MQELFREKSIDFIKNEFQDALECLGVESQNSGDLWNEILGKYSEPWRVFHNLKHISDTLAAAHRLMRCLPLSPNDRSVVALAIMYHDIIYDSKVSGGQNEKESANLALTRLRSISLRGDICDSVYQAILATDHSRSTQIGGATESIVHDADLFSLARNWNTFIEDGEKVRQEYSYLSDQEFIFGRRQFMQMLLERGRIYHTDFAVRHWEKRARKNLERLLRA